MLALKTFLASLLRGGREPRHLFLAVVLGCTAGAVGGWNLTFATLICLAALLNCSTSVLLGSAVCGFFAAHFGAGACRSLGVLLLDQFGGSHHLAKLGTGPFAALFGLDDYTTFGSLAAGLALSIPAARVFSRFATHRRGLLNLAVAKMSAVREPLLRPLGFAAAMCCAMIAGMLVQVQAPRIVGRSMLEHLSAALQTEVTADVVSYDLWNGDLQMTNLRVADSEHKSDVALVVEGVSAKVDPGLMLRGRFNCSEMTIGGLFCDPTKLSQAAPVGMFSKGPTLLKEDHPQPSHNEDPLRTVEVQNLVRNWSGVCDRLLVVQRLVSFVERIGDLETSTTTSHAFKACVDRHRVQRDTVSGALIPVAQIRHIKIDRLPSSWKLGPQSSLSLSDLTSCPALATRPASMTFEDAERAVAMHTTFQLTNPERRHELTLEAQNVPLESVISAAATRSALEPLHSGVTTLEARGWISRELLNLDLSSSLRGVQVAKSSGALAGIDAPVWRQGLERLGALRLEANVAGRWSNPKLTLVPGEVVQLFKQHLNTAGAKDIVLAFETNKPATSVTAAKSLTSGESAGGLKPQVPPTSLSNALPPAPAATNSAKPFSSGLATSPAAAPKTNTVASALTSPVPPTQPLTIQPMAMSQASAIPSLVATPTTILNNTTPPTATQPTVAAATVESPALAAAKAQSNLLVTGAPLAPTLSTATTNAAATSTSADVPASPIKTLPSETFNVVKGDPWKAPTVALGTPVTVAANAPAALTPPAPTPSTTAPSTVSQSPTTPNSTYAAVPRPLSTPELPTPTTSTSRPAIGIASDVAPSAKSNAVPKPTTGYPEEIAADTSPALGAPQTVLKTRPAETPKAAAIPTSAEATAGLRQPLSVLDPSAAPGPINMTVGYDSDRAFATSPEATPKSLKPQSKFAPADIEEPAAKPNLATRTSPQSQADTTQGRSPSRGLLASKPARPPVVDDVPSETQGEAAPRSSEQDRTATVEPAPKKKSLLNNVTGWFGLGPKPDRVASTEAEELEPAAETNQLEELPATKPAPKKKLMQRFKSMFGEEVETLPPDNAALPVDRGVVPSTGEESDSTSNVRTSAFDGSKREANRAEPVVAELTTELPQRDRTTTARAAAEPRTLNLPRTNLASRNGAKPLAESGRTTVTTQVDERETVADVPAATPKTTTPSRTVTRPAERMTAGESFYNRTVR